MSSLRAHDPGTVVVGWSYFEGCELKCAGLSKAPKSCKTITERARYHARGLDMLEQHPARRVCERMVYRHGGDKSKDPQDILDVNLVAGAIADEWLTPQEWKGSVPKEIHHRRILEKLTDKEFELVRILAPKAFRGREVVQKKSAVHNAIDAVGIGLFCVGR